MSVPLCRLLLACFAGLLVTSGPADGAFGSGGGGSQQFRTQNRFVTFTVPATAYNRATGIAVITIPRAVLGELHASKPWMLMVRAENMVANNRANTGAIPSHDLAIRASGEPGYRPLSTTPTRVLNGDKTNGWINVAMDLQFTARLGEPGGVYSFRLFFDFN